MSWDETLTKAKQWCGASSLRFSVAKSDAESRSITFTAASGSFYLTVPAREGAEEWGVWSEEDACISKISVAMETLKSASLSVEEVLGRVEACIVGGSGEGGGESSEGGEGSEDEDFDDYYGDEDFDANAEPKPKTPESPGLSVDAFFTGQGSSTAVHRLLSDLKALNRSAGKYGITGKPRGDNLFVWDVELLDFDPGSLLARDLQQYARQCRCRPVVEVEMKFPKDYPMTPPFVRIVRPRFQFLTGHVTIGGSICMQMLARSGWSPSNDIESILVQVRAEIMSDPRARLESHSGREYSESEAKSAFERMVAKYGWNR